MQATFGWALERVAFLLLFKAAAQVRAGARGVLDKRLVYRRSQAFLLVSPSLLCSDVARRCNPRRRRLSYHQHERFERDVHRDRQRRIVQGWIRVYGDCKPADGGLADGPITPRASCTRRLCGRVVVLWRPYLTVQRAITVLPDHCDELRPALVCSLYARVTCSTSCGWPLAVASHSRLEAIRSRLCVLLAAAVPQAALALRVCRKRGATAP